MVTPPDQTTGTGRKTRFNACVIVAIWGWQNHHCQTAVGEDAGLELSVSATTGNAPGRGEGKDYHFVTTSDFQIMINDRALLEYAKVFDNYYGTPSAPVMAALAEGVICCLTLIGRVPSNWRMQAEKIWFRFSFCHHRRVISNNGLLSRAQDSADVVAANVKSR